MKAMRKLIPAVCMLLVAAALLGTSTYAWFSMNISVEATGMSVKAVSTGGLAIGTYTINETTKTESAPAATAFKNNAAALCKPSELSLIPTSTYDTENWFTATAEKVEASKAKAVEGVTYSAAENDTKTKTTYYLLSKFQIKSLTTGANDELYLSSVTVSDNTNSTELNKALRIAVVYGEADPVFLAPLQESSDLLCIKANGDAGAQSAYPEGQLAVGALTDPIQLGTVTDSPMDLFVYVYYEGEDPNCYSANAVNVDTLGISLTFTSKTPEAAAE